MPTRRNEENPSARTSLRERTPSRKIVPLYKQISLTETRNKDSRDLSERNGGERRAQTPSTNKRAKDRRSHRAEAKTGQRDKKGTVRARQWKSMECVGQGETRSARASQSMADGTAKKCAQETPKAWGDESRPHHSPNSALQRTPRGRDQNRQEQARNKCTQHREQHATKGDRRTTETTRAACEAARPETTATAVRGTGLSRC